MESKLRKPNAAPTRFAERLDRFHCLGKRILTIGAAAPIAGRTTLDRDSVTRMTALLSNRFRDPMSPLGSLLPHWLRS